MTVLEYWLRDYTQFRPNRWPEIQKYLAKIGHGKEPEAKESPIKPWERDTHKLWHEERYKEFVQSHPDINLRYAAWLASCAECGHPEKTDEHHGISHYPFSRAHSFRKR